MRASSASRSVGDSVSAVPLVAAATSSSAKNGLPSAAGEHRAHECGGRGRTEDPGHLRARLLERQRRELQPPRDRRGRQLAEEAPQAIAQVDLVAAVGGHDRHALIPQPSRQEGDEVERRLVGPMEVLERQQHGRRRRRALEQVEHERMQRGDGPQEELRARRADQRRRRPAVVAQLPQRVDERKQRDRSLLDRRALSAQHARARSARPGDQLGEQPALAHAGLAAHEGDARHAIRGTAQRCDELVQLVRAPDEDPARHPWSHGASIARRRERWGKK